MAVAALLCCSMSQLPPAFPAPSHDSSLCSSHDAAVGCCLSALLGLADAPLPPQPARAARLALRFGGLGLRAADTDRHAAYWASWMDTLPAIQTRVPSAAERLPGSLARRQSCTVAFALGCNTGSGLPNHARLRGYAEPSWDDKWGHLQCAGPALPT